MELNTERMSTLTVRWGCLEILISEDLVVGISLALNGRVSFACFRTSTENTT